MRGSHAEVINGLPTRSGFDCFAGRSGLGMIHVPPDGGPPPMAPDSLTFLGGLLMGLASSLHCAGMCGAIASSLMFAFSPGETQAERARTLLAAHAGRLTMYVAGGVVLGAAGSAFYGSFDHAAAYL